MNEAKNKIRLLLVDDQNLFIESLKLVIEKIAPDMVIVGTMLNGQEAVNYLENHEVDIVLMDVRMPIMDGVTAVQILHSRHPGISIIMLTTFEDDEYVTTAMKYGAKGYLLKNIAPQMLVSAVRAVHDGSILIAPDIAGTLIQAMVANRSQGELIAGENLPDWFYDLSPRERSIIKHMLLGKNNKEIAADIYIGEQTIRNYISTIYTKLGVKDRKEALEKIRTVSSYLFA